jgi:hypothetical protein
MKNVGDKIKFESEVQCYTITARDERYIIATKPFNAMRTYLYTIIDLQQKRRGPSDSLFSQPHDLVTTVGAEHMLVDLKNDVWAVSRRNGKALTENEVQMLSA